VPIQQSTNKRYLLKAEDWQKISMRHTGFLAGSVLPRVHEYYNLSAKDVGKRVAALETIITGVEKVATQFPTDNDVKLFLAAALKERHMIAKADGLWAQTRNLMGGGSRTKTLLPGPSNHLVLPGKNPGSEHVYALEAMDPQHRPLALIDNLFFIEWISAATDLSFFEWMDTKSMALDKVLYTDPSERWKYVALFPSDRKIHHYKDPQPVNPATEDARKELLSTTDNNWGTVFSGKGFAIWVLSRLGIFYTNKHELAKFHHSSFLAGGRIKAGGEWAIRNGRLLYITHKTGHYRSSPTELLTALRTLSVRIDISKVVACVTDYGTKGETHTLVKAGEYLSKGGKLADCENLNQKLTKAAMHFAPVPTWNTTWLKTVICPYIRSQMSMNPDHLL
jgi:hypothetical protein